VVELPQSMFRATFRRFIFVDCTCLAAAFSGYQAGPTKGLFRQKNGYCGLLADNIAIEMWCRSSMSLTQKVAFIFRQLIDGTPERW
jgi:hypothetical protein